MLPSSSATSVFIHHGSPCISPYSYNASPAVCILHRCFPHTRLLYHARSSGSAVICVTIISWVYAIPTSLLSARLFLFISISLSFRLSACIAVLLRILNAQRCSNYVRANIGFLERKHSSTVQALSCPLPRLPTALPCSDPAFRRGVSASMPGPTRVGANCQLRAWSLRSVTSRRAHAIFLESHARS